MKYKKIFVAQALTPIAGIIELSTCKRVDVFLRRSLWVPHKFFSYNVSKEKKTNEKRRLFFIFWNLFSTNNDLIVIQFD